MDGILASIFLGFWSILGGKLGGKPEPRSTQKGIEKRCKKEEQRDCQKSRNKNLQPRATPRVLGPGEGVGGGVNPSSRGAYEVMFTPTLLAPHLWRADPGCSNPEKGKRG